MFTRRAPLICPARCLCTCAQEGRKTSARFLPLSYKCVPLSLPAALRSQKHKHKLNGTIKASFLKMFSHRSSFLCCFWKRRARSATDQNSSRSLSIVNIFQPTLSMAYVRVPCFTGPLVAQAKNAVPGSARQTCRKSSSVAVWENSNHMCTPAAGRRY